MRSRSLRRLGLLTAVTALPLSLTVACGGTAAATRTAQGAATTAAPARFELPRPTGRHAVGTTELHLVDHGRPDPWVKGRTRELMISVWYPAASGSGGGGGSGGGSGGGKVAPYLRPGVAKALGQQNVLNMFPPGSVDWAGARTHAFEAAPADARAGARPVVLYSPGFGVLRALGTAVVEELVSRGYVVVTMDHTYEAALVEFPGGRVEASQLPPQGEERLRTAMATRVTDTRFVMDALEELRADRNPDAEGRALPTGLGRLLDLSRIGMFGHSAGGIQAADAMVHDRRLDAGIDMDGTMQYNEGEFTDAARKGLDRPFMLMGAASGGSPQTHRTSPSWGAFWERSTGWKRDLNIPEGSHYTYTDLQDILPDVDASVKVPADVRRDFIGTVDPARIMASQRAYITAFFDRHLQGRPRPLLDRPSPRHPDIRFIP